jgi:hypothetical protein
MQITIQPAVKSITAESMEPPQKHIQSANSRPAVVRLEACLYKEKCDTIVPRLSLSSVTGSALPEY